MKQLRGYWRAHSRMLIWGIVAAVALAWLLGHQLATLPSGLSQAEMHAATDPVGWHGIYHRPLYLPLKIVRSVVFALAPNHGALLTRLPDAIFGYFAVISFGWLIWLWHGRRSALLATLLFATSAWTLHVSRLASYDALYLWAVPALLLAQLRLQKHAEQAFSWYGGLLLWGAMLYIPGMVWLLLLSVWEQRQALARGWRHFGQWWQRLLSVLAIIIWLPLLIIDLTRSGQLQQWLGLPSHWASVQHIVKSLAGVGVHVFIRGPQYPELWLSRAPLLDVFALVSSLIGIYFYARHWSSRRSRLLGLCFAIGAILIAIGGNVPFTVVVSLLYMAAATGIAYLLHDWLKVFPLNPFARGLGIGLITLAVLASCVYNYRAYYVAWQHNNVTETTFRYHR